MREILAHVQFRGTIRERSVEPFLRLLRGLRSRRRVRGVLLDISSGGGGSVSSTDLYLAVKRLDQVKPVFASIGAIGASGAYMAALGARRVYAYPDSAVGSIGVVYPHFAVQELLHKLGIQVDLVHQGRHKDAYQGVRPLTDEERTKLLRVAEDGYRGFIDLVARERHRPVDQVEAWATGEFWSGRQALAMGLVDALGDRDDAVRALAAEVGVAPEKVLEFRPPRPFVERLLAGGTAQLGRSVGAALRDGLEDAILDELAFR